MSKDFPFWDSSLESADYGWVLFAIGLPLFFLLRWQYLRNLRRQGPPSSPLTAQSKLHDSPLPDPPASPDLPTFPDPSAFPSPPELLPILADPIMATQKQQSPTPDTPSTDLTPKASEELFKKTNSLDTGLADYGKWRNYVRNHKPQDDPPFRRGRIWA